MKGSEFLKCTDMLDALFADFNVVRSFIASSAMHDWQMKYFPSSELLIKPIVSAQCPCRGLVRLY